MAVVVKIGSNIVTDEAGVVREDSLRSIVAQCVDIQKDGKRVVLVTSGAIALGMRIMGMDRRPHQMDELQAASAVGQGQLYGVYDRLFRELDVGTAQVLLTFFDISARAHYLNAKQTLTRILAWNRVPIINENDTTATDEISFGDNDFLSAQIATLIDAEKLILLTDIGGLYTADPALDAEAELVSEVTDFEVLESFQIGLSATDVGVGGMRSKVVAAEMASAAGITTVICNGFGERTVTDVVGDKPVGTVFRPQAEKISSFKLWLKYAKAGKGTVTVDGGAVTALTEASRSLLPVGIVKVEGAFQGGDAVTVVDESGAEIGKGICNYSAEELDRLKGLSSAEIQSLTLRPAEEAIHRDYLILA